MLLKYGFTRTVYSHIEHGLKGLNRQYSKCDDSKSEGVKFVLDCRCQTAVEPRVKEGAYERLSHLQKKL